MRALWPWARDGTNFRDDRQNAARSATASRDWFSKQRGARCVMDPVLQRKHTIVTGGSRDIGNTIARGLASEVSATQWRRGLSQLHRRTHARIL